MRNAIGLGAVLAMVTGPLLAHFGVTRPLVGFVTFALGGIVALLTGLVSVAQLVRGRGLTVGGAVAMLAGLVLVGIATQGRGAPRINDFTTDPTDPPAFHHAGALAPNAGRDMGYPADYAAIQRECCADLRPVTVRAAPADTYARAVAAARAMPTWTITSEDPKALTFEAVDTTRLFRFQDDIVVRVRGEADGTSRVDVRSKSRDGKGDMGVNARRIRAYVAALDAKR